MLSRSKLVVGSSSARIVQWALKHSMSAILTTNDDRIRSPAEQCPFISSSTPLGVTITTLMEMVGSVDKPVTVGMWWYFSG